MTSRVSHTRYTSGSLARSSSTWVAGLVALLRIVLGSAPLAQFKFDGVLKDVAQEEMYEVRRAPTGQCTAAARNPASAFSVSAVCRGAHVRQQQDIAN